MKRYPFNENALQQLEKVKTIYNAVVEENMLLQVKAAAKALGILRQHDSNAKENVFIKKNSRYFILLRDYPF